MKELNKVIKDENHPKSSMEQEILEVAERMFLEKGFSGTSTTAIAQEVGCNQALIHYYYRTKEKLFNIIFENKLMLFVEKLLKTYSEDISLEERLKLIVESHFDLIVLNPKFPRFVVNELLSYSRRLNKLNFSIGSKPNEMLNSLQRQIDTEVERGSIRPIRAIDLLVSLISLNVGAFVFVPLIKEVIGLADDEMKELLDRRKSENVILILNSLKVG